MSPVGVNNDIITNGKNGYLASTDQEWFDILSTLIENPELRVRIGKEGRKTVIENFSVKKCNQTYLEVINGTTN